MADEIFCRSWSVRAGACGRWGGTFAFAVHPEFLREGTAVNDFFNPPKTVMGSMMKGTARSVAWLYDGIDAPVQVTTPAVAMMVKYTDNTFHALKVAFANEIGRICKKWNLDAQEVMALGLPGHEAQHHRRRI